MYSTNRQCNEASVQDRQTHTNVRIYDRNVPSNTLPPNINARPVQTQYTHMQMVDHRETPGPWTRQQHPAFDVSTTFNPGNTKSPWRGFVNNVDTESVLRNQVFALQCSSQAVYVPDSNSELYISSLQQENDKKRAAAEIDLQASRATLTGEAPLPHIGYKLFNNSTSCRISE